jgi:hypothetical protein
VIVVNNSIGPPKLSGFLKRRLERSINFGIATRRSAQKILFPSSDLPPLPAQPTPPAEARSLALIGRS